MPDNMPNALPDDTLNVERLRLHLAAAPIAAAASLLAASAIVALALHAGNAPGAPLAWLAAVAGSLVVRLAIWAWHRRHAGRLAALAGTEREVETRRWLNRHRAAFLLHGLAWASVYPLMTQLKEGAGLDASAFIVTGMVGGAVITGAFDWRAASAFALPATAALFARLLLPGGSAEPELAVAATLFLLLMVFSGRRFAQMLAQQVKADQLALAQLQAAQAHGQDAERARRRLADSLQLQEQLLRDTPQGYWFIDQDGRTVDLNPAMCRLLGRSREAMLDLGVFDIFTGAEREVLQQQLARRRAGATGGYELDIVRPDGSRVHAYNQATPIRNEQGESVGSIGLWTDLTAHKQLERDLRTYERVTNSISEVVAVVGRDRRYWLVNDAWCRTVGLRREEALGRVAEINTISLATPERLAAMDACLRDGQASTIVSPVVLRDGRQVILQTGFYPYHDSALETSYGASNESADDAARQPCSGVMMITRDITEQERDRAALEIGAEFLSRTLNATGDGLFAVDRADPDAPVRFVNEQFLAMFGLTDVRPQAMTTRLIMAAAGRLFAEPETEARLIGDIIKQGLPHSHSIRLRDGRTLLRRFEPATVRGQQLRVWSFRDITAEEHAVADLHERDLQQRALLDAFPGFISVFDAELNFLYVNQPVAQLAGRPREEMRGRHVSELIGAKRAALLQLDAVRVRAGERVVLDRQYAAQGREVSVQTTLAAGRDPRTGAPVLYAFGSDISELKRAESALRASEAEMRALLRAFPGYIAAADTEARYVFINERLAALLERRADDVLHRPTAELLGEARAAEVAAELERARRGEVVRAERRYRVPGTAEFIDVEVTHVAGPLAEGGAQTVYTFGIDITARKRALAALAAARDEADRANRAKSQFLSHMSHELRTPLNAVLGFAQLLRRDTQAPLSDQQQGHVQQILRGATHLLALINEVLDLGRIEAGQLHIEPDAVPAAQLLGECQAFVGELARQHGTTLLPQQVSGSPVVLADRMRLRQVLLNLLGNAIKYNRPRGQVQLLCRGEGAEVLFEVRDTGPGISAELQGRLFQPFERLGAERGSTEGTGIGLALCRRLVEAMNGQVGLRSEVGVGSTFWVRLPAAVATGAALVLDTPPVETASTGQALKVLCIDDNEVNLLLVESMLARMAGVQVFSALQPAEGLKLAQREKPAVVLVDIHMPGMDGFAVLARLRAHPATALTPVVAVSADALPGDLEAARAAGFAAYLTKPLDLDRLLDTVQRLSQPRQGPEEGAT